MSKAVNISQVQPVMDAFRDKYTGIQNAKHAADILFHLKGKGLDNITGKGLQAVIGYIRKHDMMYPYFILSNVQTGYWITKDNVEQKDFINQELSRMSNQFGNLELLHSRLKKKDNGLSLSQATLF